MSPLLILASIAFGLTLVFAFVLGHWHEALEQAWPRKPEDLPRGLFPLVTLIVPVRNGAATIVPLLQDLYAQQWPKERMQVLVMDDGSTDGTADLVKGLAATWPGLELVKVKGAGKKAAIAEGVAAAQGEWVLLTDADARCGPGRLAEVAGAMENSGADLLLLPVATLGAGLVQRVQVEEQLALQAVMAGSALRGRPVLANGANLAFRKASFLAVGGYLHDPWASGDDIFLLRRMEKAGMRIVCHLAPAALVAVQAEAQWRTAWRQRLRWAGKMRGAMGMGTLAALCAIALPWYLAVATSSITVAGLMRQRPLVVLLFLAGAWLLWLLPVLRLVKWMRTFQRAALGDEGLRGNALSATVSLLLFSCYAPLVALCSLVVRPRWKGRRT